MVFQGIEYDLRDVNDRMALSEKLLAELCRIFRSDEMKSMTVMACVHGFTVPMELATRNAMAIAASFAFLEQVKSE